MTMPDSHLFTWLEDFNVRPLTVTFSPSVSNALDALPEGIFQDWSSKRQDAERFAFQSGVRHFRKAWHDQGILVASMAVLRRWADPFTELPLLEVARVAVIRQQEVSVTTDVCLQTELTQRHGVPLGFVGTMYDPLSEYGEVQFAIFAIGGNGIAQ